jgi:ferric-dicitrate binding protein FerR (iron transport regulator)
VSIRDRAREALYSAMNTSDGSPASARRATQLASTAANTAAERGHVGTAAAIALAGAAAVAAESALTNYVYPPGDYATFRKDSK